MNYWCVSLTFTKSTKWLIGFHFFSSNEQQHNGRHANTFITLFCCVCARELWTVVFKCNSCDHVVCSMFNVYEHEVEVCLPELSISILFRFFSPFSLLLFCCDRHLLSFHTFVFGIIIIICLSISLSHPLSVSHSCQRVPDAACTATTIYQTFSNNGTTLADCCVCVDCELCASPSVLLQLLYVRVFRLSARFSSERND